MPVFDRSPVSEVLVPHIGWLRTPAADRILDYLAEGWFEYREQAFLWLLLRPGDCFVDCGAHMGLFSVLAARVMEDRGRIIGVEPNPEMAKALMGNLDHNGVTCAKVVEAAVFSASGPVTLRVGAEGQSAYSSLYDHQGQGRDVEVAGLTIDELLEAEGIERVAFLKLDVEGAEIDALAGCQESIEAGRLPLVSVEFSEKVLNAANRDTAALAAAWAERGYVFYRFDPETMQLAEVEFDGPIWYENLHAIRDRSWVDQRLAEASEPHRRIAREIVTRGQAASRLNEDRDRLQNEVSRLSQSVDVLTRHRQAQDDQAAALEARITRLAEELEIERRPLARRFARWFSKKTRGKPTR